MPTAKSKQSEDSLLILEKVMKNSYQRKMLKEVLERIQTKMVALLDTKFPSSDFEKLKEEFISLKNGTNIP